MKHLPIAGVAMRESELNLSVKSLPPYTMRYPVAGLLTIRMRSRIFFPLFVLGGVG
jgi:hypothetical protein